MFTPFAQSRTPVKRNLANIVAALFTSARGDRDRAREEALRAQANHVCSAFCETWNGSNGTFTRHHYRDIVWWTPKAIVDARTLVLNPESAESNLVNHSETTELLRKIS